MKQSILYAKILEIVQKLFFYKILIYFVPLPESVARWEHPLSTEVLRRIVSEVCQWRCGYQLFIEMVQTLKDKETVLVCCNKPDTYGLKKELFSFFDTRFDAMREKCQGNKFLLLLNLSTIPPSSFSRNYALMNFKERNIQIKQLTPEKSIEGFTVSHEFYHVCSFLRKIDKKQTVDNLNDPKNAHNNELKLFFPLCFSYDGQNPNSAMKLFENGEEMRNLCGLKIIEDKKLQEAIGEFDFWQEALGNSNGMIIPLYNENLSVLTTPCYSSSALAHARNTGRHSRNSASIPVRSYFGFPSNSFAIILFELPPCVNFSIILCPSLEMCL